MKKLRLAALAALATVAVASVAGCRTEEATDNVLGTERTLRDPYRGMGAREDGPKPANEDRPLVTPEGDPTSGAEPTEPVGPLMNPLEQRQVDGGLEGKPLVPNEREPQRPTPGSAPDRGGQPGATPGYRR